MISESLGFNGEVVVIPYIDLENWWGQDPEYMKKKREKRLDDIKNEIPPLLRLFQANPIPLQMQVSFKAGGKMLREIRDLHCIFT